MYKLNNMRYLLLCLTFLLATATPVSASESDGIDVKEIVLGHLMLMSGTSPPSVGSISVFPYQ